MSCPHCHESARFVEYRPRTALSLVGPFPLERAYYHRRDCGTGHITRDLTPGLSRQAATPGARQARRIPLIID